MKSWTALIGVLALASACSSAIPTPLPGAHESEEPIEVPGPPPPAHVEVVPERPLDQKTAVWVDGEWVWKGRRWVWQGGQWEVPEPGSSYAPPVTIRRPDGKLAHFPGAWKYPNGAGAKTAPPPADASATPSSEPSSVPSAAPSVPAPPSPSTPASSPTPDADPDP